MSDAAVSGPWHRYAIGPVETPLRVGLILWSPCLQRWQVDAVRALRESGVGTVVAAFCLDDNENQSGRSKPRRSRSKSLTSVSMGQVVEDLKIDNAEDDAIQSYDLDVLLDLTTGLTLPNLTHPRLGIWSFHFGDNPTSAQTAITASMKNSHPAIRSTLVRSAGDSASQELRQAVTVVHPDSRARTLDRLLEAASMLPLEACRDILQNDGVPRILTQPTPKIAPQTSNRWLLLPLRVALAKARRWLYGAFILKQWAIGLVPGGPEQLFDGKVEGTRWISSSKRRRLLADPMIVPGTGGSTIVCEAMDYADGFGVISRLQVEGDGTLADETVLLEDARTHLSYPGLVPLDEGWLLVPEAGMTGDVRGFILNAEADEIVEEVVLIEGLPAIDPTIFQHEDHWWLLCTEDGDTSASHLWLYHADDPLGPWSPHPANPIVTDVRSARPAGPPFLHHGTLYRPSQDCSTGYGSAVTLSRIVHLSSKEYSEESVATLRPNTAGERPGGLHTVSIDDDTVVIDGYKDVFHPLAGWYRYRAMRKAGKAIAEFHSPDQSEL